MWKPEVIQGGKQERIFRRGENFKKGFEKDFRNFENHISSEEEILEVVREVAMREEFLPEDLEISQEVTDPKENVIELVVRVRPGKAQGRGWQSIDYRYTLRGTLPSTPPTRTEVARIYNESSPEGAAEVTRVAECIEGKWRYYLPLPRNQK